MLLPPAPHTSHVFHPRYVTTQGCPIWPQTGFGRSKVNRLIWCYISTSAGWQKYRPGLAAVAVDIAVKHLNIVCCSTSADVKGLLFLNDPQHGNSLASLSKQLECSKRAPFIWSFHLDLLPQHCAIVQMHFSCYEAILFFFFKSDLVPNWFTKKQSLKCNMSTFAVTMQL